MSNGREMVNLLKRRLPAIAITALACAALVYAYLSMPRQTTYTYKSSFIAIPNQTTDAAKATAMTDTAKGLAYLLNTKNFTDSVMRQLNIPEQNAYQTLTVSQVENNAVIEVSATGATPDTLRKLVDGIVTAAAPKAQLFGATLTVLEAGEPEEVSDEPANALKNAALGLVGGAVLASCLILLLYYFNDSVKNEAEVAETTGMPVVARFPHTGKDDPDTAFSDLPKEYREAVGRVAFYAEAGHTGPAAVGVSFAGKSAGLPAPAFRLAELLAYKGSNVLLFVLDPAAGPDGRPFPQECRHSLDELLQRKTEIGAMAAGIAGHTGLHAVWATGIPSLVDHRTLGSLRDTVALAKTQYDYVVLALPAVGMHPDVALLPGLADVTFLAAEALRTKTGSVAAAANMARASGVDVAGFILTQPVL